MGVEDHQNIAPSYGIVAVGPTIPRGVVAVREVVKRIQPTLAGHVHLLDAVCMCLERSRQILQLPPVNRVIFCIQARRHTKLKVELVAI
eukprot:CAMPEP_0181194134 /NCGR_PEP_ID=MMETSP1096-20121128/14179_1 /TAXON_ID=156174 ORGANISM="Chrysochromulina ericina, Strain CCMP281" /NCGR_SAMPLE_ID=MMETSP1096 /ASSEMBLY_ACC=CAM_ASM_000453 /LENGTH=88 /DNA_ID=CAMNT_0023283625 /DNA_START=797 /DNA_END=1063 /DNA_ORIENTATION=-